MTRPIPPHGRALQAAAVLLLIAMLGGCTTRSPVVPAIGDDGEHRPGNIVWHELLTSDMQGAGTFYQQLFGWEIQPLGEAYGLVHHNGRAIAGIAQKRDAGKSALWLSFMSVDDVDATVSRVKAGGGDILLPATNLPGRGRVAVVADNQGVVFGLIRSSNGDPEPRKPGLNDWLWREVWSQDRAATEKFYADTFDMRLVHTAIANTDYRYFAHAGKPRIGLVDAPAVGTAQVWMVYVRVADPEATAKQAEALGGSVLLAPDQEIRADSVAVIADPTGGVLVVQKWDDTGWDDAGMED